MKSHKTLLKSKISSCAEYQHGAVVYEINSQEVVLNKEDPKERQIRCLKARLKAFQKSIKSLSVVPEKLKAELIEFRKSVVIRLKEPVKLSDLLTEFRNITDRITANPDTINGQIAGLDEEFAQSQNILNIDEIKDLSAQYSALLLKLLERIYSPTKG